MRNWAAGTRPGWVGPGGMQPADRQTDKQPELQTIVDEQRSKRSKRWCDAGCSCTCSCTCSCRRAGSGRQAAGQAAWWGRRGWRRPVLCRVHDPTCSCMLSSLVDVDLGCCLWTRRPSALHDEGWRGRRWRQTTTTTTVRVRGAWRSVYTAPSRLRTYIYAHENATRTHENPKQARHVDWRDLRVEVQVEVDEDEG